MVSPFVKSVDTSGLNRAIELAMKFNNRAPELAVCTAGFFVAREVSREAPRVSMETIDDELDVDVIPILSTRGARKDKPRKDNAKQIVVPMMSPAIRITLARFWHGPNVRYNALTHDRYYLDNASFSPGQGRKRFWAKIEATAKRMVKTRHSSIAFLASSVIPVIKWLEQRVAPKYRRGAALTDVDALKALRRSNVDKGEASLYGSGTARATLEVDLLIGMGSSVNSAEQNDAMHRLLGPVVQRAVNSEAAKATGYAAMQELKRSMAPEFRQSGVLINV